MAGNGPCVCADYIAEECNEQANCEWYEEGDSCRTSVWLECQMNPDCRLIVHTDHHYKREDTTSNKKNKKMQQTNPLNSDADAVDYPYVCSSGALFQNVISVQTNILAARQRAKAMVIGNRKNVSNNLSVALMACFVALATFIGLCAITLFYKKKMKKVVPSASEESTLNNEESNVSYATFF